MSQFMCPRCGAPIHVGQKFSAQCALPLDLASVAAWQRQAAGGFRPGPPAAPAGPPGLPGDVEVIKTRIRTGIPAFVRKTLAPSEQVLGAFSASLFDHRRKNELRHDKFVLTNQRVIYFKTAIIHQEMGEMSYRQITEVHYNRGLRHGKVIIEAANAGLILDGILNDDAAFAERVIAGGIVGRRFQIR